MGKPTKPPVDRTLTGTARDNSLAGDSGNDTLNGLGGNDYLFGRGGNDKLYGGDGNDRLYGEQGDDYLDGGAGNDTLIGDDGRDILSGGSGVDILNSGVGDDTLDGGLGHDELLGAGGADTLTGGADDDWFIFLNQSDSRGIGDIITDYQVGIDRIFVGYSEDRWDANESVEGVQTYDFVGDSPLDQPSGVNGQATVLLVGDTTVLKLFNNDGDTTADFVLTFQGHYQPSDLQLSFMEMGGPTPVFTEMIHFP
ncbi:calcium-binding protein [Altererythrobacter sp. TH136]|uniref:calcium-binding protein n=1 Tax=Altererythrobacter sp. TH136 TaxID=2067415 RepID=UPI0011658C72|nr:calcium-binding protein [Altererythrobacter sp. TH136]QDM41346.1 calcium-binding protein [Altererythrobacter sp. TH136]